MVQKPQRIMNLFEKLLSNIFKPHSTAEQKSVYDNRILEFLDNPYLLTRSFKS